MSKTLDLIIKAEQKKHNKHTLALDRHHSVAQPQEAADTESIHSRRLVIEIVFFCILLLSLTFNFKLFTLVKDKDAHIDYSQKVLISFQGTLDRMEKNMGVISGNLNTIKTGLTDYEAKVTALKKRSDTQGLTLKHLTSATNTLSGNVHKLEANLDMLKTGGQQ